MTKTWGFGDPSGPLQFSTRGWLERARAALKDGDTVAIVGTLNEPTALEERGKLLGLMEPSRSPVSCLDYDLTKAAHDYDEQGNYKWPFGLELRAAWSFDEPLTDLSAISNRAFNMDAVQGIVPLDAGEAQRVLALPRKPAGLLRPLTAAARIEGRDAARRKAAPPPTTTRRGVMHMRRMSAFTYAMEITNGRSSAFKIGWSFDHVARARHFNLYAMPQLGGLHYRIKLEQLWPTAMEAFRMEQTLLRKFDQLRHTSNTEVLAPMRLDQLQAAWIDYISERRSKNGP